MGMYTQIITMIPLKPDTPRQVITTLMYMTGQAQEHLELPDHPLFHTPRWHTMLRCSSAYFPSHSWSDLRYNDMGRRYSLSGISDFKNYNNELELFLDWIRPYIEGLYIDEPIALSRYECSTDYTIHKGVEE